MRRGAVGCFLVLMTACRPHAAVDAGPDAQPVVPGAARVDSNLAMPRQRVPLELEPIRFERGRISFEGLADVTPEVIAWDVGGAFVQTRNLADPEETIRVVVRAHPDETLDAFVRDHQAFALSERAPTVVCGRAAEIARAHRPEERIACVITGDGQNHPAYVPPTEIVAVSLPQASQRVLFSVEVSAARPGDYKVDVEKILASIRCD